jgi:hypothetical protein
MLDLALAKSPARLVTLQRRNGNTLASLSRELHSIRSIYNSRRGGRACH